MGLVGESPEVRQPVRIGAGLKMCIFKRLAAAPCPLNGGWCEAMIDAATAWQNVDATSRTKEEHLHFADAAPGPLNGRYSALFRNRTMGSRYRAWGRWRPFSYKPNVHCATPTTAAASATVRPSLRR